MSCPICSRTPDPKYRPFCSRRCSDVDLARWLNGSYAIPAEAAEEDDQSSDKQISDGPTAKRPQ